MESTGYTLPQTATNIPLAGANSWNNVNNILVSGDNSFAHSNLSTSNEIIQDEEVRFSFEGSMVGDNKADTTGRWGSSTFPPDGNTSNYGGTSDDWNIAGISPSMVNDSTFALNVIAEEDVAAVVRTARLRGSNFGFSIPSGSTILGLQAQVNKLKSFVLGGNNSARIYWVQVNVHYELGVNIGVQRRRILL